ncbi:MAG: DedA family protein [Rhodoluna sp.]|jgi:membrane-associated protein
MIKNALPHLDLEGLLQGLGPLAMLIVCLIIIAETGLLVGFFLPGDSLLFTVGLMIGTGIIDVPIWLACILISASAIAGDQLGYFIGRKAGPAVFRRPNSKFFSQKNAQRAQDFFVKYGAKAVIFAHFVPIMRTFVPVAAGVGQMKYAYYLRYNIIGALTWGILVPLIGFFLGQIEFVRENVVLVTLVLVGLSLVPVALEVLKARKKKN